MLIRCVWEHNGGDSLLYAADFPGAFTRGASREIAEGKMGREMEAYLRWSGVPVPDSFEIDLAQERVSELQICDADSDVIFGEEKMPLTRAQYEAGKALALKSAGDFLALYEAIPDKHRSAQPPRGTFYGQVPRTAEEMYRHTKNVNSYYFGEIGVEIDNDGTIMECRERGFLELEKGLAFPEERVIEGSYGEWWSVRKVLRRFVWHDRIHAKAMYRMAVKIFAEESVPDIFGFGRI